LMIHVVDMMERAHRITHPLFNMIFDLTWSENRQWVPEFMADEIEEELDYDEYDDEVSAALGAASSFAEEPVKELVEYFDFVQKVMGGAIAEIWKGGQ